MFDSMVAAYLFSFLIGIAVAFQLALAIGMPWGEMAMGGKFPGRFPVAMRIAALFQILLLLSFALIVLARANLALPEYFEFSAYAIWIVVFFSFISAVLNTITPSKKERMLWSPVAIGLLICSIIVAVD
ncbi:MAG: hypothetical protein V7459_07060 [Oceanicoccus sp.]